MTDNEGQPWRWDQVHPLVAIDDGLLPDTALGVAQAAVAGPPVSSLVARMAALQRYLGELQRLGQGFVEVRNVLRPVAVTTTGPTGAAVTTVERRPFGPYAYYRWHEGNKLRSLYLGRADQPADWRWKLVDLGVDLEVLGLNPLDLADEADATVRALHELRDVQATYVQALEARKEAAAATFRGVEEIEERSHGDSDV